MYIVYKLQILTSATPLELSTKVSISSLILFLTSSTTLQSVIWGLQLTNTCLLVFRARRRRVQRRSRGKCLEEKGGDHRRESWRYNAARRLCAGAAWPRPQHELVRQPWRGRTDAPASSRETARRMEIPLSLAAGSAHKRPEPSPRPSRRHGQTRASERREAERTSA